MEETKKRLGVVIGRFQIDLLHDAHRALIQYVKERNDKVIVYVGVSPLRISQNNPLSFFARVDSIQHYFPGMETYPIQDYKSDKIWSDVLDAHLVKNFSDYDICLYGSRDSFIDSYHGGFRCERVKEDPSHVAAQLLRKGIGMHIIDSPDFRKGIIHASLNRFPVSYQTVDIACLNKREILLGRKPSELKWRLPGGFVDPVDASLEDAAYRELHEECGSFEHSKLWYLGSQRVDDWRYRKEVDKIMTGLFLTDYIFGKPVAGDDLAEVKWFSLDDIKSEDIEPEHISLIEKVINALPNTKHV